MREIYLQRWARSTVEHYQFDNVGFADIEGHEYYGALANNIAKHGLERFNGFLADLQVSGMYEDGETARLRPSLRRRRLGDPGDLRWVRFDEAGADPELFAAKSFRRTPVTTSAGTSG